MSDGKYFLNQALSVEVGGCGIFFKFQTAGKRIDDALIAFLLLYELELALHNPEDHHDRLNTCEIRSHHDEPENLLDFGKVKYVRLIFP